ncbi:hypothetical protein MEN41_22750 [Dolichospermum sp. ST_con]|nr:hypothetical protein [Dolichospermum sp. ST_con]MDD1426579.1 hypothetical protein [Dolichospermum sp. ST_sed9]MDD1434819.1 hypothetical protein [Dolichospermum sp. ST_sed6]MDD1436498.1 hypothetical protein [Dolichospermum sp. ST_sed10]MDD1444494.1 hypothetical protein [Dolichospermum sp. ST_sed3]MDD1448256.1 hypothetical protein [Dolichospermum sp. ST_sed8]MDD1458475.1 hypothetical protein [Dolichospermum sp. ST_sed7]MDD1462388.1 hypothetical protein [Dolichospermum sp. ST_sed2]MDD146970
MGFACVDAVYSPQGWTSDNSGKGTPNGDPNTNSQQVYVIGVVAGVGINNDKSVL